MAATAGLIVLNGLMRLCAGKVVAEEDLPKEIQVNLIDDAKNYSVTVPLKLGDAKSFGEFTSTVEKVGRRDRIESQVSMIDA